MNDTQLAIVLVTAAWILWWVGNQYK